MTTVERSLSRFILDAITDFFMFPVMVLVAIYFSREHRKKLK